MALPVVGALLVHGAVFGVLALRRAPPAPLVEVRLSAPTPLEMTGVRAAPAKREKLVLPAPMMRAPKPREPAPSPRVDPGDPLPAHEALAGGDGEGDGAGASGAGVASSGGGAGTGSGAPIDGLARRGGEDPRAATAPRPDWIADAVARIRAARHYPELARRRGVEGQVRVGFVVDERGGVRDVRVLRGADEALDEAAVEAVRRAAPLPPIGRAEVVLDFRLDE